MTPFEKQLCHRVDNRVGIQPVVAVEIGQVTRLAEPLGAEWADTVALNTANPAERGGGTVQYRHQPRIGGERCKQIFDV